VLWIRIRIDLASENGSVLGIWDSDPGARKQNKKQISLNLDLSNGFFILPILLVITNIKFIFHVKILAAAKSD
jgi:hypothetical protein